MKLFDFMLLVDDDSTINIWKDGELIAVKSDGNDVREDLKEETVKSISAGSFLISVEI